MTGHHTVLSAIPQPRGDGLSSQSISDVSHDRQGSPTSFPLKYRTSLQARGDGGSMPSSPGGKTTIPHTGDKTNPQGAASYICKRAHSSAPGRVDRNLLLPCAEISPSVQCLSRRVAYRVDEKGRKPISNAGTESCTEPDREMSILLRQRHHTDEDKQGGVALASPARTAKLCLDRHSRWGKRERQPVTLQR